MTIRLSRRAIACALYATTAYCGMTAQPAAAQEQSITPFPVREYQDENGVDLATGVFTALAPSISIGSKDMGLTYKREVRSSVFRENIAWNIAVSGSTYTVALGTRSVVFILSGTTYTPVENNGDTLTYNSSAFLYTYTGADGTIATFAQEDGGFGNAHGIMVQSITYPSGRSLTYNYAPGSFVTVKGNVRSGSRLTSVATNAGYLIHFVYAEDDPSLDAGTSWGTITKVVALNSATDSCNPISITCTVPSGRPKLDISGSTYTDAEGRATQFSISTSGVTSIRLPGSSSNDVAVTYTSGKATSVTNRGVTTGYAYSDSGNTRTVTVTRPDSSTRILTFDIAKTLLLTDTDELGRTTSYQYDANNRLTRGTQPEGNYTQFTYDTRGNVTEKRMVAKSGSGLSDIVLAAGYDTSCTNGKTCNQPNWTKDALGNQTDYTYDSTHGGLLTVTAPAATAGANRPQTRITYSRLDSTGAASLSGIFVPTASSTCQTGTAPSCVGTSDEVKSTITYGYGLLPASTSTGDGAGTLTATAANTYDAVGNLTYLDGPLSGTADTTRFLYNSDREQIGVIAPDPDGAGSLQNRASRVTYGATGLVTKKEAGTTNGQTDTAWAAFSTAQTVGLSYDANRRLATSKLSSGGSDYALTQYSYDSRGRSDCTAVRMNPAVYSSLPSSACTLGTSGSYGSDRISQTVYDNASEPTQLKVAVGTSDAATERTLTYSNNGKLATLLDAESNLTTFEYDGFDRLAKTRYPNTTKGSGTSSTTDYEQFGYDANGNVTSRRLRDGNSIAFTFDNLNRVTFKDLPSSEPDVTYSYDLLGRMTGASQTGNSLSFTYDALSRKLTETGPQGTATSAYDLAGRRTQLTYPGTGLYVNTDYLVTGEPSAIRENGATSGVGVLASYAYDNLGNRTGVTFGNGVSQVYTYDAVSRLASLTNDLSGTTNDLSVTFAYNPADQITQTVRTGDAYAWTGHGSGSTSYTANGLNQQVSIGGSSASWDSKGNITADPTSGRTYGYSSENLLTSASGGVTLGYDPATRLYQVAGNSTTRFAYDGLNAIADYDGSNALQHRYVFGPGVDQPIVQYDSSGNRSFLSSDERGSIVSLTDSSGALTALNTYDEYGKPGASNTGRFQYTGQKWIPEIGAYDYKARVYLPQIPTFAQADPVGYAAGANRYDPMGGDPVNATDPTGEAVTLPAAAYQIIVTGTRRPSVTAFDGGGVLSGSNGAATAVFLSHVSRTAEGSAGGRCPARSFQIPGAAEPGAAGATAGTAAGEAAGGTAAEALVLNPELLLALPFLMLSGDTEQPKPDITIYRVVGNVEYAGIRATNSFQLLPGGGETKQFWLTAGDAQWYANSLPNLGWKGPVTTVSTRVSQETLSTAEHFLPDNRPGVAFRAGAPLDRLNADAARNGINIVGRCGGNG